MCSYWCWWCKVADDMMELFDGVIDVPLWINSALLLLFSAPLLALTSSDGSVCCATSSKVASLVASLAWLGLVLLGVVVVVEVVRVDDNDANSSKPPVR